MSPWPTMFLCLLISLFCLPASAQESNNDPSGKSLFVSEPFCTSYQCTVNWQTGNTYPVQWLNPTMGNISIELSSRANSSLSYVLAPSIPANLPCTNYNDTSGLGCGQTNVTLGFDWVLGNYSLIVTSLNNSDIQGYSDVISLSQGTANPSESAMPSVPFVSAAAQSLSSSATSLAVPPLLLSLLLTFASFYCTR